jgi:hypothetical protein
MWAPDANAAYGVPIGDAARVCDNKADGWGVKMYVYIDGYLDRTVTTQGHSAGYCTPWTGGNLPEGTRVWLLACLAKSGYSDKHRTSDESYA